MPIEKLHLKKKKKKSPKKKLLAKKKKKNFCSKLRETRLWGKNQKKKKIPKISENFLSPEPKKKLLAKKKKKNFGLEIA